MTQGAPPAVIRDLVPGPVQMDVMRYRLALATGWTLDVVDELSAHEAWGLLGFLRGDALARAKQTPGAEND